MEQALFIIVIILGLILVLLLGAIVFFLFRYLRIKEKNSSELSPNALSKDHPSYKKVPKEVRENIHSAKESRKQLVGSFCVDHPDLPAKGRCAISDELYCDLCLTKENDVKVARKFLNLFLDHEWPVFQMLNNEEVGADKLNEVMRVKKELWKDGQIPIITQRQFKINIESDEIETFTVIMVREVDKEVAKQRFGFLTQD